MSHAAKTNQRDRGNSRSVWRLDGETLSIDQRGGSTRDRWSRSFEKIRRRKKLSRLLIGRLGHVVEPTAAGDQHPPIGKEQTFGVIQPGGTHGCQRRKGLGSGRPQFSLKNAACHSDRIRSW